MQQGKAKLSLYYILLYVTAFAIPLPFIAAPIAIGLLGISWLTVADFSSLHLLIFRRKGLLLWLLFFLLHVCSYFLSSDKGQASFDIQTKLSFLLLPLFAGTGPAIDDEHLENIASSFILSLFLIAVYSFGQAFIVWSNTGNVQAFFYHNLVEGLDANAVYYALYTFLALTFLLLFRFKRRFISSAIFLPVALLLFLFFIFLAARLLLLLFFITVLPLYLNKIKARRKWMSWSVGALGILFLMAILFTNNPIQQRYNELLVRTDKSEWLPEYSGGKKQHFTNLTLRLFLWNTALRSVREDNLWLTGCGIGDVNKVQKKQIEEYGNSHEILNVDPPLWEYNIHNMYIQTLLMLGLPGLALLLGIASMPFAALRNTAGKATLFLVHISFILFMLQESAFQTQAGIIFYCFFSVVTFNYIYSSKLNHYGKRMRQP